MWPESGQKRCSGWSVLILLLIHALRSSPATAFLAGNWDELLLVLIFLAWSGPDGPAGETDLPVDAPGLPHLPLHGRGDLSLFLIRSPHLGIAIEGLRYM